jgi:hypothetical protein
VSGRRASAVRFSSIPATAVLLGIVVLPLLITACRQGVPIIDPTARPARTDGTISGIVRGPEGTSPVVGRTVEVVNVETGERQRVETSTTGGFTFKVKPGKYRVELALLQGEVLVKKPSVITVNASDVDAHADFVIGSSRLVKPRSPRLRGDDGLGSPIA